MKKSSQSLNKTSDRFCVSSEWSALLLSLLFHAIAFVLFFATMKPSDPKQKVVAIEVRAHSLKKEASQKKAIQKPVSTSKASPPSQSADSRVQNNNQEIYQKISQWLIYPESLIEKGIEGSVEIRFRISPEGFPTDFEITQSSKDSILDQAAIEGVQKAAPFEPLESEIVVTIDFKLPNSD